MWAVAVEVILRRAVGTAQASCLSPVTSLPCPSRVRWQGGPRVPYVHDRSVFHMNPITWALLLSPQMVSPEEDLHSACCAWARGYQLGAQVLLH